MLEVYWGCLLTGIVFALLTVIFDDFLGSILEGLSIDLHGMFQTSVIISALTSFGGVGVLFTTYTSLPLVITLLVSIALGLLLSVLFYFFYVKPMENTENSIGFSIQDLVGMVGEVTIPIPKDGYGEIVLSIGGSLSNQIAASFENFPISAGTKALVIEISEDTLLVSPYEQL